MYPPNPKGSNLDRDVMTYLAACQLCQRNNDANGPSTRCESVWRHDLWQPANGPTMPTDQPWECTCDVMTSGSLPTDQRCQRTNHARAVRESWPLAACQRTNDANAPTMREHVTSWPLAAKLRTMPSCQRCQRTNHARVVTSWPLAACQRTNDANGPTMRECVMTSWPVAACQRCQRSNDANAPTIHTYIHVFVDGIKLSLCLLYPM